MGVLATPNPEVAMIEVGALFRYSALLGTVIRRQQDVRLVVQIDADVAELTFRNEARKEVSDRVVALPQGGLATFADQLVARHRGFDRLIFGHFRMGKSSGATSSSMLRGTPG